MALPGALRDVVRYRVRIGEGPEEKRNYPQPLDYIMVSRRAYERGSGEKPRWVRDDLGQKMLESAFAVYQREYLGQEFEDESLYGKKPVVCPIELESDEIDEVFTSGMAFQWGNVRLCSATQFEEHDLSTDSSQTECKLAAMEKPEKLAGEMLSDRGWQALLQRHPHDGHICRPSECKEACPRKVNGKEARPFCNPFCVLICKLPFLPVVGTKAEFRSHGWASGRSIKASLVDIKKKSGGVLSGIPLVLRIYPAVSGGRTVYAATVEFLGGERALRDKGISELRSRVDQGGQLKQLSSENTALSHWTGFTAQEIAADIAEFTPDNRGNGEVFEETGASERFDGIARAMQWTESKKRDVLATHGSYTAAAEWADEQRRKEMDATGPQQEEEELPAVEIPDPTEEDAPVGDLFGGEAQ